MEVSIKTRFGIAPTSKAYQSSRDSPKRDPEHNHDRQPQSKSDQIYVPRTYQPGDIFQGDA